jgi:CubicO group peptidase (beta-lactamase class C family)
VKLDPEILKRTIDSSIDEHALSGVVAVRQEGAVLYESASGYADRSNQIPNTLETRFGIASGTKFFTALAIGKLIAAQKLSLSTKLKNCVALDFPRYSPEITIRHLLTHTSGIPDYYDEEKITDFSNFKLSIPWYALEGPRDYLPAFPDEEMKFPPGERFCYSNGGYILLGVVIEELTGVKYQNFVRREIFESVGMTQSGYFAMNRLPAKTALGYVEEEGGWRTNVFDLPIVGASDGGAFSTVEDIATLWQAFWSYEILPKEVTDLFAQPYIKASTKREDTYYGHGLWVRMDGDRTRETYFSGCDAGVSFRSSVNRENGMQVTVISNTTSGAWPVLRDIDTVLNG